MFSFLNFSPKYRLKIVKLKTTLSKVERCMLPIGPNYVHLYIAGLHSLFVLNVQ
jgi:hypothetical protein